MKGNVKERREVKMAVKEYKREMMRTAEADIVVERGNM